MFSLVICAGCNNTDLSRLLYQLQDWTVFSVRMGLMLIHLPDVIMIVVLQRSLL